MFPIFLYCFQPVVLFFYVSFILNWLVDLIVLLHIDGHPSKGDTGSNLMLWMGVVKFAYAYQISNKIPWGTLKLSDQYNCFGNISNPGEILGCFLLCSITLSYWNGRIRSQAVLLRAEFKGRARGSFSVSRKISLPVSLYYDPSLIKNFYKTTNPLRLIKPTPFCAYDLTGRYSSVSFKLTPLPLIPVECK